MSALLGRHTPTTSLLPSFLYLLLWRRGRRGADTQATKAVSQVVRLGIELVVSD